MADRGQDALNVTRRSSIKANVAMWQLGAHVSGSRPAHTLYHNEVGKRVSIDG